MQDSVPAGTILLLGTTTQIERKTFDGLQNCFSLARSDGKRTYYIQASSKEELEDWVGDYFHLYLGQRTDTCFN